MTQTICVLKREVRVCHAQSLYAKIIKPRVKRILTTLPVLFQSKQIYTMSCRWVYDLRQAISQSSKVPTQDTGTGVGGWGAARISLAACRIYFGYLLGSREPGPPPFWLAKTSDCVRGLFMGRGSPGGFASPWTVGSGSQKRAQGPGRAGSAVPISLAGRNLG